MQLEDGYCVAMVEERWTNMVFTDSKRRQCAFKARVKVGDLCLCRRHAKLAKDGLVHENGDVVTAPDRKMVRRYPKKFPDGFLTWANDLQVEDL